MNPMEFFYTVKPVTKIVTEEQFFEFVNHYPRKLSVDVTGISEPPLVTYNDFELANRWPYSIVAQYYYYSDDPDDYLYAPEEERYYMIMENYEEVFNSKTGNAACDGE